MSLKHLVIFYIFICFHLNAHSQDTSCFEIKNGILNSYDYERCGTEVVIPKTVNKIAGWAFINNKISSVIIPNSVTEIGPLAFSNNKLASIVIPDSVKSVGREAFSKNQLMSVKISNLITKIEYNTFDRNKLTSVLIPKSVSVIGEEAFARNKLDELIIPDSVLIIEKKAFYFNSLTSLTIPDSIVRIESSAFENNSLKTVSVPETAILHRLGVFDYGVDVIKRPSNQKNPLIVMLEDDFSQALKTDVYLNIDSLEWTEGLELCSQKNMRLATVFDFTKYVQYQIERYNLEERKRLEKVKNPDTMFLFEYSYTLPASENSKKRMAIENDSRVEGYSVFKYNNYHVVDHSIAKASRDVFYRLYNNKYPSSFLSFVMTNSLFNKSYFGPATFWTSSLDKLHESDNRLHKRYGTVWESRTGGYKHNVKRINREGYSDAAPRRILCVK